MLTIVVTFDRITEYRQKHRRLTLSKHFNVHLVSNRYPIVFEPFVFKDSSSETSDDQFEIIDWKMSDEKIEKFLKYFFNYFFYRFGFEICSLTTIILIGIRLDFISILYGIWLGFNLISSRHSIGKIWPIYSTFLWICYLIQYFLLVGFPPFLCLGSFAFLSLLKDSIKEFGLFFFFRISVEKRRNHRLVSITSLVILIRLFESTRWKTINLFVSFSLLDVRSNDFF